MCVCVYVIESVTYTRADFSRYELVQAAIDMIDG